MTQKQSATIRVSGINSALSCMITDSSSNRLLIFPRGIQTESLLLPYVYFFHLTKNSHGRGHGSSGRREEQDGNRKGWRRHNFQKLASESYHKSVFGPDSELLAPVCDTLRGAARRWAKQNEIAIADFSSPRTKAEGYHYTVAQCNACVNCSA